MLSIHDIKKVPVYSCYRLYDNKYDIFWEFIMII